MSTLTQRLFAAQTASNKTRPPVTIPFKGWAPDRVDFNNPGDTVAENVIPDVDGYRPMKGLAVQSDALTGTCLGAVAANDTSNNTFLYAGDATKLYELRNQTFSDESNGTYAVAASDVWEFAAFGQVMIATDFTDAVQSIAVGGGASGAFADMITSTLKPKAKHVGIVRDFVVLGNTSDGTDGHQPGRVWWSAIRDENDFDPDADTQCDFNDLRLGGWVQRVIGGVEYGLIFSERAIHRMTYVGSPLVFNFDAIDRERGTPIPGSVIGHGRRTFFISEEGFYENDGIQSYPIGHNMVDREFWGQFDIANRRNVTAAIDPVQKLVAWAFPGENAVAGAPNRILIYNWLDKRWALLDLDVQIILRTSTQGFTLEDLDSISTDIETFTDSFDSDVWKGGALRFAAFDTDNKLNFFTGDNLQAEITTTEFELGKRRAKIRLVRLLVDSDTLGLPQVKTSIASRVRQGVHNIPSGTISNQPGPYWQFLSTVNTNGEVTFLSEGRYHRIRLIIPAGESWTHAQGVEVTASPTGTR